MIRSYSWLRPHQRRWILVDGGIDHATVVKDRTLLLGKSGAIYRVALLNTAQATGPFRTLSEAKKYCIKAIQQRDARYEQYLRCL